MYNVRSVIHVPSTFASGSSYTRKHQIEAYTKLLTMGTEPFYAADAGLSGGMINAMATNGWIRKTGRTKTKTIEAAKPVYDGNLHWHYEPFEMEVTAFEWQIVHFARASRLLALMEQMDKVMRGEDVL